MKQLTFTPEDLMNFHHTNPHLRWGQAFHQKLSLEKRELSESDRAYCDALYQEPDTNKAKTMVIDRLETDV